MDVASHVAVNRNCLGQVCSIATPVDNPRLFGRSETSSLEQPIAPYPSVHHGQRTCVPGPAVLVFAGDVEDMASDKRKRKFLVGVRLSDDERTALEDLAASRQKSLPAFLRAAGLRQRLNSSTAAISIADRQELRRIKMGLGEVASNLNYLAKSFAAENAPASNLARQTEQALAEVFRTNAHIREVLGYDR